MVIGDIEEAPAHRPSRRHEIVSAAIRQFAESGFGDTSVGDVAAAAGMTPTAVYYHFAGKDELFTAAISETVASISEIVAAARTAAAADGRSGGEMLDAVIDAVWSWIDDHPDEARLLYVQLPLVTQDAVSKFAVFEDRHVEQAFGYFEVDDPAELSADDRAVIALRARTLVGLTISVHTIRLGGGMLADSSPDEVRSALHHAAGRLVGR